VPNKSFSFDVKQLDDDTGEFIGYASTYDNEDLGGDVVCRGAFAKTLLAKGPTRPLLLQHRDLIGTVDLADDPVGLVASGRLTMGVEKAREALALLKSGALGAMSIGFESMKDSIIDGVRHLKEIRLYECSLVTFPMNEMAVISSVKQGALEQAQKQAAELAALREIRSFRGALKKL
jgi:HK97 family phage prohead protease